MSRNLRSALIALALILGRDANAQTSYGPLNPTLNGPAPLGAVPTGSNSLNNPSFNLPLSGQPGTFNPNGQIVPNAPDLSNINYNPNLPPSVLGNDAVGTGAIAPSRANNPSNPNNGNGSISYPCMMAIMQESQMCAMQSPGGAALQTAGNAATNSANSACTGAMVSAIAAMGAASMSLTSCPSAHGSCTTACGSQGPFATAQCNSTYSRWRTGMALTLGLTGVGLDQAMDCANGTNSNDPAFQNPTYNPTNLAADPAPYAGGQTPYNQAAAQYETPTGSGSGTGAPPAPYPGGAGAGAGAGKDAGAFKDVALGTSNGGSGGGGFPGNTVGGGGWPGGQKTEDGLDLQAILNCQLKGGKDCRDPASVPGANELAAANGDSNFVRVTKKMREKQPNMLPSKDGHRT